MKENMNLFFTFRRIESAIIQIIVSGGVCSNDVRTYRITAEYSRRMRKVNQPNCDVYTFAPDETIKEDEDT